MNTPGSIIEKWGDLAWAYEHDNNFFIGGHLVTRKQIGNTSLKSLVTLMKNKKIRYSVDTVGRTLTQIKAVNIIKK